MMNSGCIKHQRDIHALFPGMYQTSKGNTFPPFSMWCCSAFTVTTGTFDPPAHREISLDSVLYTAQSRRAAFILSLAPFIDSVLNLSGNKIALSLKVSKIGQFA